MERRNNYQKDKEIMKQDLQRVKPCPVNTKVSFSLEVCKKYVCIKYFEKQKLFCNTEGGKEKKRKKKGCNNEQTLCKCLVSTRNRESPLSFDQHI